MVIGRAWVSHSAPVRVDRPLGVLRRPVVLLDPGAEPASARSWSSDRRGARSTPAGRPLACRRPAAAGRRGACPPGGARALRRCGCRRTKWSGLTAPETTASPSPGLASMTVSPRRPGHRVGGEQHAGDRGVHHPLHHDGEPRRGMVDPVARPVGDRPVGPERRPAAADRVQDGVRPDDRQVRVLLPGEAGERQVLGGRRGPDRDGRFAQLPVGGGDRVRHAPGAARSTGSAPVPAGPARRPGPGRPPSMPASSPDDPG